MTLTKPVLAVLGGTGALGSGLALRWAKAGYHVIIGSRTEERSRAGAQQIRETLAGQGVTCINVEAMVNQAAAAAADIVALTVPFSHQRATLEEVRAALAGKILIDATVPLVPPKVARVQLPAAGSAGQIAQDHLGESVRVVSAFHNVSAELLQSGAALDCDVLVFGNDKPARQQVVELVAAAGLRGFHGGTIANSAAAEALTSVLIFINKQYGGHAGVRITGTD